MPSFLSTNHGPPSAFPQGKQIDKGVAWAWGKRIHEHIPPNTKYVHPRWLLQPRAEGPPFPSVKEKIRNSFHSDRKPLPPSPR